MKMITKFLHYRYFVIFFGISSPAWCFVDLNLDEVYVPEVTMDLARDQNTNLDGVSLQLSLSGLVFNGAIFARQYDGQEHLFGAGAGIGIFNFIQLQFLRTSEHQNYLRLRSAIPIFSDKNDSETVPVLQLQIEKPMKGNRKIIFGFGFGLAFWD